VSCPPGYRAVYGGINRNSGVSSAELLPITFGPDPNDSGDWLFRNQVTDDAFQGSFTGVCLLVEDPESPTSEQAFRDVASTVQRATSVIPTPSSSIRVAQTVDCPNGHVAIGGGLVPFSPTGENNELQLRTFAATAGFGGWQVDADETAPGTWNGRLVAECLLVAGVNPPQFQLVSQSFSCVTTNGGIADTNNCNLFVGCPAGFLPISGGIERTTSTGEELIIRDFRPATLSGVRGWFFNFDDINSTPNYAGTATVFCLKARDATP
jgi:hypothetical protein